MTRKKITMEFMENDSARKVSLKKRRLSLLKKVEELTTLCGVDAGIIIYSPEENDPMSWPSHDEIVRLLERFRLEPETERWKKSMNMESYNRERLLKSQDQLVKFTRKKKEEELGDLMLQLHQGRSLDDLNINELNELICLMEPRHEEIINCIDYYKLLTPSQGDVPSVVSPQVPQVHVGHELDRSNTGIGEGTDQRGTIEPSLWEDWFDDLDMTNTDQFQFGGIGSSSTVAPNHLELPGPAAGFEFPAGYSFHGSSSVAPGIGESRPLFVGDSSSSVVPANLQLPAEPSFGGTSSSSTCHYGLPPAFDNFIDPTIDMGPGHYPFGSLGSGSPIGDYRGNPFGFFGGESSSGGAAHNSEHDDKN